MAGGAERQPRDKPLTSPGSGQMDKQLSTKSVHASEQGVRSLELKGELRYANLGLRSTPPDRGGR